MKQFIATNTLNPVHIVYRRNFVRFFHAQSNLTHLPRHEYVPGVGLGTAKCPYDPLDNSTAIWSEKGNPGQLPALYSGTNAEFTKADTVIFRTDLFNLTTGRKEFAFKRTLKYDSNWLDSKCTCMIYNCAESEVVFSSKQLTSRKKVVYRRG